MLSSPTRCDVKTEQHDVCQLPINTSLGACSGCFKMINNADGLKPGIGICSRASGI